jgi:hypothetical protein
LWLFWPMTVFILPVLIGALPKASAIQITAYI